MLTTIVSVNPVYVDFNVDERAIQRYQQADFRPADKHNPCGSRKSPSTSGWTPRRAFPHEGTLVFADIKYAGGTGTILVRGEAENTDGQLIPGSRVRVRLPVGDKYSATLVPDAAVNYRPEAEIPARRSARTTMVCAANVELGRLLDDGMRVVLPSPGRRRRPTGS